MNIKFTFFLTLLIAVFFAAGYAFANDDVYTGTNASAAIVQALQKQGANGDVKVHINEVKDEEQIATSANPITSEVGNLNMDKEHNLWRATLYLKAADKNLAPVNLSGSYDEIASIPVLKRTVKAGEIITAEDIEYSKLSAKHLRKNTITDSKELIGKSPRRIISQERPIRLEEISEPVILLKGAHVTMIYKSNNLEIRTIGEAMDSGAKGDIVRIKNLASKAIISGVVQGSDAVRVSSPENNSAEAM